MMDLPPLDPGIEIVAASQGMSKGILQAEDGQLIVKALVQLDSVQVGGQWKNVSSTTADGEAAAFINLERRLGTVRLNLGLTYKWQTGVEGRTDSKALEISTAASRKFGPLQVRLSGIYSPDDFGGTRESLFIEGGPMFELDARTRVSAAVGRRMRVRSPDYTSFNIGATRTIVQRLIADLRYYDTDQGSLGKTYRGRVILSGRWSF